MVKTNESEKPQKITKIKQSDIYSFRMDTIECFGEFINKEKCFFSSSLIPGSPDYDIQYTIADDIDIDYSIRPTKYKYKLTFYKSGTPVLAYYEGDPNQDFPTKNYYTVYGKAWRALETEERILDILNTFFRFDGFRRLDTAMDVLLPLDTVLATFKKLTQKGADFYGSDGEVETHFIGAKQKSQNRYLLIRLYDKIKEIRFSKTQKFYVDYLVKPHMTRIELEFREELCKNITWEQAQDKQFLKDLFCTYINKHTKIFTRLQKNKIKLTRAVKSLDLSELTPEEILNSNALKMFKGLARNFKEVGICPVHMLLLENRYDDNTISDVLSASKSGKLDLMEYKHGLNYRNVSTIFRT